MRYWFTTHWPRIKGGRDTLHIYLREEYKDAAPGLAPGDRVLIYEFRDGPRLQTPSGVIRREPGAGGVICEAKVATALKPRPSNQSHETYVGGRIANWAWIAETEERQFGLIPGSRVKQLLGYQQNYHFRGFNNGKGIMELDADQYHRLMSEFRKAI